MGEACDLTQPNRYPNISSEKATCLTPDYDIVFSWFNEAGPHPPIGILKIHDAIDVRPVQDDDLVRKA